MALPAGHQEGRRRRRARGALDALAEAGAGMAQARGLAEALQHVAAAVESAAAAGVVVIRVLDPQGGCLTACAVASSSAAIEAELEGTRVPMHQLRSHEVDEMSDLPDAVAQAAARVSANAALMIPVPSGGETVGSVELLRSGPPFTATDRSVARVAASQTALAIRAFADDPLRGVDAAGVLLLAGDALATGADEAQTAEQVVRLAVETTGAVAGLLWRAQDGRTPSLSASYRLGATDTALADAAEAAERAVEARDAVTVESAAGKLPAGAEVSATLQLGQPPIGALQLLFASGRAPSDDQLARFGTFGVRAAQALRNSARTQTIATELERTRALLGVVGQAISELSLAHTLETAVRRIAELVDVERLAVYLREGDRLYAAAGLGLAGPHVRVAERLLELALGPFRSRGIVAFDDVSSDPRLAGGADAAAEAGIEGVAAVPLLVHDEPIGLLALFPHRGHALSENEAALVAALATQLAVAVQNAQLHERAKRLGAERERALSSERAAARQLRALYEISRSFAQSLSLEATLEAVATTVTDLLNVDVAMIAMVDERGERLEPRAIHVVDERMEDAVRAVVWHPLPFGAQPVQHLFRLGDAFALTPQAAEQIGGSAMRLASFLEHGWSGAVVPVATTAEVLAALMILSVQPDARVTADTMRQAEAIAGQAALAIDNARLYQQQKEFADTMQRSLLPRTLPELEGLDIGDAYQSSARVEVGGDVYDFAELENRRLAVVLGDVTGHGIEAAADMAMAKFVFRSLAREHPEPGEFLRCANDVVVGEIAPGKFITMAYLVVDAERGEVAGAGAGHPPPRIVTSDGTVTPLDIHGLVLGIEPSQDYEEVRASLPVGASVVLYTDGVLEARNEGELYGFDRLDAIVSAGRELSAQDLAETVLADCRDFANNELADDCAVVVIKRTA